jgi:hypothetical protein
MEGEDREDPAVFSRRHDIMKEEGTERVQGTCHVLHGTGTGYRAGRVLSLVTRTCLVLFVTRTFSFSNEHLFIQ